MHGSDVESGRRDAPRTSRGSLALVRTCAQPVLAAAALLTVEIAWLDDRALVASPTRLGVLATLLLTLTCVVGALAGVLRRLLDPVHPARRALVATFACTPVVTLAGRRLFAGPFVRDLAGVLVFELAFDVALLLAIHAVLVLHERLGRTGSRGFATGVALLSCTGALLSGWADTHVLVGRDVSFHLLLGCVTIASAFTAARATLLAVPARLLPTRLGVACAVACVLGPWTTWATWSSPASAALSAYSDGLVPELRLVVDALRAGSQTPPRAPAAQDTPLALALDATHALPAQPPLRGPDVAVAVAVAVATTADADAVPTHTAAALDPSDVPLDDWAWSPTAGEILSRPAPDGDDAVLVRFPGAHTHLLRAASSVEAASVAGQGEWRARVSARVADATSRGLTLELSDGSGLVATRVAATLGDDFTELATPWTRLVRPALPTPLELAPSACVPEAGAAFTVSLPAAWTPFASTLEAPVASLAVLLEDGSPLGPSNALHQVVRTQGRGAYSHWNDVLYFSTSDGSDPRDNGRRYELVLASDDLPPSSIGPRLALSAAGRPLAAWVRDVHLEHRPETRSSDPPSIDARVARIVTPSAIDASLGTVPAEIVAGFDAPAPDQDWVGSLLEDFWALPDAARPWLLRAIYRHDLTGLRFQLELLERGSFEDDDQRVLALRAWAGSRIAAERLAARFDELSEVGRTWLVELLSDLPGASFELLEGRLLSEFTRLASQAPALGTPDERRLALLASGLPLQLGQRTPRSVRQALVERFNAYSIDDPGPAFATLGREPFTRARLLRSLCHGLGEDGLELLDGLTLNRDVAITVPETCLALGSEASRHFLLALIARWKVPGDATGAELSYMLPALRRIDDVGFREEANRILRRNYPLVWVHP